MSESLHVDLNREQIHEVSPSGPVFETDGSFDVRFRNHGRAVHVHLRLDETLSSVATVEGDNHFVDTEGETTVHVRVQPNAAPLAGSLEIVTGYGSETARVRVHVTEPEPDTPPEPVEEGLPVRDPGRTSDALVPGGTLGLAGFAAGAILLAVLAFVAAPSPTVAVGALVVLSGVLVAGYLLLR